MGSQTGHATAEIAVTSVRIERDKLERFREVAEANRRSVSQELRWLIDRAIETHDQKPEAVA
jgi:hypothetical protein